jgi:hypothetical protein
MIFSMPLVALFLAGVSHAAPAAPANTSVPLVNSTTISKNATAIVSGQNFTDVAPTVDLNRTITPGTDKSFKNIGQLTYYT